MKKIKLPLEMANGVMVRSLDELKENWDLEKIVEHFVTGKLTTWLNDRYYTDLAEKVENLPKDGDGRKLQQALCRVFEVPCEELELDVDGIAERKRRQDLLRQYTSDDEVLKNIDKVAFDQEDLAYLLDDEVTEIYLFNGKFTIPLTVEGKKYIGIGDNAVAEIRSKKPVNFAERGIAFSNVKFDEKYAAIHKVIPEKPKFSAKVGDIIKLGEWHSETVEWQILEIKDGKALLLSKYGLDSQPYQRKSGGLGWRESILRTWLNTYFYENCFSKDEMKAIQLTDILDCSSDYVPKEIYDEAFCTSEDGGRSISTEAEGKLVFKYPGGKICCDRVFLLHSCEVVEYLKEDYERMCKKSDYLKMQGRVDMSWVFEDDESLLESGYCVWWLRSEHFHKNEDIYEASVTPRGLIGRSRGMHADNNVVRPAMWVDLSKM